MSRVHLGAIKDPLYKDPTPLTFLPPMDAFEETGHQDKQGIQYGHFWRLKTAASRSQSTDA